MKSPTHVFAGALAMALTLGGGAMAQVSTDRVAANTDWSVFAPKETPPTCWAVSAPRQKCSTYFNVEPAGRAAS